MTCSQSDTIASSWKSNKSIHLFHTSAKCTRSHWNDAVFFSCLSVGGSERAIYPFKFHSRISDDRMKHRHRVRSNRRVVILKMLLISIFHTRPLRLHSTSYISAIRVTELETARHSAWIARRSGYVWRCDNDAYCISSRDGATDGHNVIMVKCSDSICCMLMVFPVYHKTPHERAPAGKCTFACRRPTNSFYCRFCRIE